MPTTKTTSNASANGHKRVIDFNKIKAAKAEVAGEPVFVKIGKETIELPPVLPAMISFLIAEGRVPEAMTELLGDNAQLFWDEKPTMEQVNRFWDGVADEYGLGEAGE